jgi:hypothetical protein
LLAQQWLPELEEMQPLNLQENLHQKPFLMAINCDILGG